jgi:hypothetical protein
MENCKSMGNHSRAEVSFLVVALDHAEDKICIFGFSRGAYTARALAGMLHKVCAVTSVTPYPESNLTRSVVGGTSPRGEPPAGSLRV